MLTRLYVDNFKCLVNFEYRPSRRNLIVGANGSGKSTLLEALLFVRQFVTRGDKIDDSAILAQRTRWMDQPQMTYELEAELDGEAFAYRLVIEPWGEPLKPRVKSETVRVNEKLLFEFKDGEVHLFNDRYESQVEYPFDAHRSALATLAPRKDNMRLSLLRTWLSRVLCFRMNPFAMDVRAEREDPFPNVDLSNIAAWYRHLVQAFPRENEAFLNSLRAAIDGFSYMRMLPAGENTRIMLTEFSRGGGEPMVLGLQEMSDGQRALISLYAILHFVLANGATVIIDEPENFISLRELQPWLIAVSDMIEERKGQVLIISHHPEFINQWAPSHGVLFSRDTAGPVRVQEFRGSPLSSLTPAELIARGWEHE